MSRKPTTPRALPQRGTPQVPDLSGSANAAIARLEGTVLMSGEIVRAYYSWRRLVTGPRRTLERFAETGDLDDGIVYPCCEPEDAGRDLLARAARMLPRRNARELRRAVAKLDAIFMARSRQVGRTIPLSDW